MTTNDSIRLLQKSGTKMTINKLLDIVKKQREKDIAFVEDRSSGYIVILLKMV